ncbi:MAG: zinc ribbon domain-containing protein [Bacilli bacterium]|nr:zinc ribbon domain-containing protein [Bacilli bacterium]
MYCSECGAKKEKGVCPNCHEIRQNNNINEKVIIKRDESLGITSLIIGIIAILLAIIINVLVLPLAILGLILGIINRVTTGKKISGIVLNAVAIVLSFVVLATIIFLIASSDKTYDFLNRLYNELKYSTEENYVSGKYSCKSFDGSVSNNDYIVTMQLNKDKTFLWAKYGEEANNYVKGDYTFKDLKKTNPSGDYKYFDINLDGSQFVKEGTTQDEPYQSNYEFGLTEKNAKKQGILMNKATYNMYYCYED